MEVLGRASTDRQDGSCAVPWAIVDDPSELSRPVAYAHKEATGSAEIRLGLAWLAGIGDLSREGLIITPVQSQLRSSNLTELTGPLEPGQVLKIGVRRVRAISMRMFPPVGWRGGPVLALWLGADGVGKLHDSPEVEALCLLPWLLDEILPWVRAVGARDLLGVGPAPEVPRLHPVAEQAMKSLTSRVNLSTGLGHPSDRSAAIEALRILEQGRIPIDGDELQAWAVGHGWQSEAATELGNYARGVIARKAYRTERRSWGAGALEHWKEQAQTE